MHSAHRAATIATMSNPHAAAAIALNDLADQVAAAADLDAYDRQAVEFDIEVGDSDIAIFEALMGTRTPLPADLLKQIRAGIDAGWWTQPLRDRALVVLDSQSRSTQPVIDRFRGEHFFLSNFSPAVTPHRGRLFATSEHAYMAAKTTDGEAIAAILATEDAAVAQRIGRAAPLVDDWEQIRFGVMDEIVAAKFTHNAVLAAKLAGTAGSCLVEGNDWHDQTWGDCSCPAHRDVPGANALGMILMDVRAHLG